MKSAKRAKYEKTILHANLTEFGDSCAIHSNSVLNNDIRRISEIVLLRFGWYWRNVSLASPLKFYSFVLNLVVQIMKIVWQMYANCVLVISGEKITEF